MTNTYRQAQHDLFVGKLSNLTAICGKLNCIELIPLNVTRRYTRSTWDDTSSWESFIQIVFTEHSNRFLKVGKKSKGLRIQSANPKV